MAGYLLELAYGLMLAPGGNASASPVAEKLGFLYNFAFGMLFSLLGCAYVVVFVGDSRIIRDQRLKKENDEKVKALKLANKFKGVLYNLLKIFQTL